jgi:hypothetical protein
MHLRFTMPIAEPLGVPPGAQTRPCASPRLRQSLGALDSGYGLNEDRRAVVLNCSEAWSRPLFEVACTCVSPRPSQSLWACHPAEDRRAVVLNCSVASSGPLFEAVCTCASPRLRQSLGALGSGYGLNEEPTTYSSSASSVTLCFTFFPRG